MGYICVTCSHPCSGSFSASHLRPLCLLVYCFSAPLGIMFNNSAIFISAVRRVSLIVAKSTFGVGCFNAYTKSRAANVDALADDTLDVFTF